MIVVDTGPIVALLNDRDDHHERCRDFLANYPGPLLVPTTVFTEVCLLAERRRGTRAELAFLKDVRAGLFTLLDTASADLERIAELVDKYRDLPLGTVDASVIALTERLNLPAVATLDRRHFSVVRPRHVGTLALLP
ncbi:type II toxin-antitoxin system toxin ribonuclease C26 [Pseudonocardia eucalypti]|uniref:Ribonuclease VapC n=1 Tax=Pseudonocardia eucalypti TaxID=648755 RepID=A0ABP9QFJ7_9PSEU|nr:putative nucleic acid-binding protein [Pseudonocardia eucalypti]